MLDSMSGTTARQGRLRTLLHQRRGEILAVAAQRGAHNLRVFGSVARGEEHPDSDIDILVDFEPRRSLLDQAGLMLDLEALLGVRVDVVSAKGLLMPADEDILEDAVPL